MNRRFSFFLIQSSRNSVDIDVIYDLSLSASFYHTMYVSEDYSEYLEKQLGMFDITYTPRYYFNSDKIEKENIPKVTGIDEYGHGKVVELDGKYYLNTDDVVK